MNRAIAFVLILTMITATLQGQTTPQKHISVGGVAVDIIEPANVVQGDMLILPGWNFAKERWCNESSLCTKALSQGYRLILPEMHKSVYAEHYFPETRQDWRNEPTLLWITDTLIPYLQDKYNIFTSTQNYVIGLSTGARGVVLCCIKTGHLFKAGAALSGDYDQTTMQNDNLMRGFYGPYAQFANRWKNCDNPTTMIDKLLVPIYFGHGMNDKVVPPEQTTTFYQKLVKRYPHGGHKLHCATNAGHDFQYWDSEVDAMLQFFFQYK